MARLPSLEEIEAIDATLQPYFRALGKVAHSWNHMHEELGKVFCAVTGLDSSIGMAIWHGLKSDRSQRDILESAVKAKAQDSDWAEANPHGLNGVLWLTVEANKVADRRNNAIHAPCNALLGDNDFEIKPITYFQNKNAARLMGKDILAEFAWYERTAATIGRHATDVRFSLDSHIAWPRTPELPSLGQGR